VKANCDNDCIKILSIDISRISEEGLSEKERSINEEERGATPLFEKKTWPIRGKN